MFGKSQCKSGIHRCFVFVVIPCNGSRSVAAEKQIVASLLLAREAVPNRMESKRFLLQHGGIRSHCSTGYHIHLHKQSSVWSAREVNTK